MCTIMCTSLKFVLCNEAVRVNEILCYLLFQLLLCYALQLFVTHRINKLVVFTSCTGTIQ